MNEPSPIARDPKGPSLQTAPSSIERVAAPELKHVGITATRSGVTNAQIDALAEILRSAYKRCGSRWLHHGDCIGGDEQGCRLARDLGYGLVCHQPSSTRLRAWVQSDVYHAPMPYLDRNRALVDASSLIVGCPDGKERLRSGTWATIRYARKLERHLVIIDPQGETIEVHGYGAHL